MEREDARGKHNGKRDEEKDVKGKEGRRRGRDDMTYC